MVGTFPLARGYEGTVLPHAFNLLVLGAESFIQINQVNSVVVERPHILTKSTVLQCHAIGMYKRNGLVQSITRGMNVSLTADVLAVVE